MGAVTTYPYDADSNLVSIVDPLMLDFGDLPAGGATELIVTVTSIGADELVIGTVGGSNTLDHPFSIVADGCSGATLAVGEICQVSVQYSPSTIGTFTDSFDIPSNDGASPTVDVSVRGTATEEIESIPTMGELGVMIFGILIAILGSELIRRRFS